MKSLILTVKFMLPHHRSSFFLVLIALSLLLAGLMIWKLSPAPVAPPPDAIPALISLAEYQAGVAAALADFEANYREADQDFLRLLLVEELIDDLLNRTVPAEARAAHLDLVLSLSRWRQGLRGEVGALDEGRARFARWQTDNPQFNLQ